jgi:hypothetical protein
MFGKENVPKIGKRFMSKKNLYDLQNQIVLWAQFKLRDCSTCLYQVFSFNFKER